MIDARSVWLIAWSPNSILAPTIAGRRPVASGGLRSFRRDEAERSPLGLGERLQTHQDPKAVGAVAEADRGETRISAAGGFAL